MQAASSLCPHCGGINCTLYSNGSMFCNSCSHSWTGATQHVPVTPTPPSSFPVFLGSPGIPDPNQYRGGTPLIPSYYGGGIPQLPLPPYATVAQPIQQQPLSSASGPQVCPKCKSKHYWKADGRLMRCMGCNSPWDPDGKITKTKKKTFQCSSCKKTKPIKDKEYGKTICKVCADD